MTTDNHTPDPAPALLPPAHLAEIRERADAPLRPMPDAEERAAYFGQAIADRAALLAHLDALTPRAVVDGEALPALEPQHTPTTDRFDGEVWRGRVKVDDDWAHVAVRTIDGATVPMFYWHGKWRPVAESFGHEVMAAWAMTERAAGRSEGEAERARLQDALDLATADIGAEEDAQAEDAATIARLTAALRTETTMKEQVQDQLVEMRGKHREEWERAERLTAELAEAQAAVDAFRALPGYPHTEGVTPAMVKLRLEANGAREERDAILHDIYALPGAREYSGERATIVRAIRARATEGRQGS